MEGFPSVGKGRGCRLAIKSRLAQRESAPAREPRRGSLRDTGPMEGPGEDQGELPDVASPFISLPGGLYPGGK